MAGHSWWIAVVVAGCACDRPPSSASDCPDGLGACPFRDEWRVEVDAAFPYLDAEGEAQIFEVIIGRGDDPQNFVNRGDVIVEHDGEEGRILIEIRRFTMAGSEETAEEDFAMLMPWAFSSDVGSPKLPQDMPPESDCSETWSDGCAFYVFYEGMRQLSRSGADIRVTLPPSYRHDLTIATSDNAEDADYHNRGNVCVSGLRGSAEIELESGTAIATLAETTLASPTCPAEMLAVCEASGWDASCPCIAEQYGYGTLRISSDDGLPANALVDTTETLWAALDLTNMAGSGSTCTATVEVPGFESVLPPGDAWHERGSIAQPEGALEGHGYSIQLVSGACGAVTTTESPEAFVGKGNGTRQTLEQHGHLQVCSGCVRALPCDELLPGG